MIQYALLKKEKKIFPSLDLFFSMMYELFVARATMSLTCFLSDLLPSQNLEKVMWMTQRGAATGCRLHSNFTEILYFGLGWCEVSCLLRSCWFRGIPASSPSLRPGPKEDRIWGGSFILAPLCRRCAWSQLSLKLTQVVDLERRQVGSDQWKLTCFPPGPFTQFGFLTTLSQHQNKNLGPLLASAAAADAKISRGDWDKPEALGCWGWGALWLALPPT